MMRLLAQLGAAWLGVNVVLLALLWFGAHRRARRRPAVSHSPTLPDGASAAIPGPLAREPRRRGAEPQAAHSRNGSSTADDWRDFWGA